MTLGRSVWTMERRRRAHITARHPYHVAQDGDERTTPNQGAWAMVASYQRPAESGQDASGRIRDLNAYAELRSRLVEGFLKGCRGRCQSTMSDQDVAAARRYG